MATVDAAVESQIRNIEAKYGKSMPEWLTLIKSSGKTRHGEIMTLLKREYGITHGDANRIALTATNADAPAKTAQADPAEEMYAGKEADLRPIHDALMAFVAGLGSDIEVAPKKGYVSLRRKKQFAMIQPTTAARVDVGLNLRDEPTTDRLEAGAGFNAMFTHRVRLAAPADVDAELLGWFKQAYEQAG